MKKLLVIGLVLLVIPACHKAETGDPPIGTGNEAPAFSFSATVLSESQIQLSWDPAVDDLLASTDLTYGIWYTDIEANVPDVTTGKAAVSFTLNALEPETDYTILVRAYDGANYSTNTTGKTVTTCPETGTCSGVYGRELAQDLTETPSSLIKGAALNRSETNIGVIEADRLNWYSYASEVWTKSTIGNFDITENILEAHLVKTGTDAVDELFILTASDLSFYANSQSDGFDQPPFVFSENAVPGTLDFTMDSDGKLDVFSYIDQSGVIHFYERNLDSTSNEDLLVSLGSLDSRTTDPELVRLGDCNGDGYLDLVYLAGNQIYLFPGEEKAEESDDLVFGDREDVDTIDEFRVPVKILDSSGDTVDDTKVIAFNTNNLVTTMGLFDGDGSGLDIYFFFRDETNEVTQLFFYEGNGDNTFEAPEVTDYHQATFDRVSFQERDEEPVLVALQTASNNLAIYEAGTNGRFSSLVAFYGYGGTARDGVDPTDPILLTVNPIDFAILADVGGGEKTDLVMISEKVLSTLKDTP